MNNLEDIKNPQEFEDIVCGRTYYRQKPAPPVVGMGVIVNNLLYQPIEFDGDPWDGCDTCDCEKPCFADPVSLLTYCGAFGQGKILHLVGKVTEVIIDGDPVKPNIHEAIVIDDELYRPEKAYIIQVTEACQFCEYEKCPMWEKDITHFCESFNTEKARYCLKRIGRINGITMEASANQKENE